jgi:hypothetical protein
MKKIFVKTVTFLIVVGELRPSLHGIFSWIGIFLIFAPWFTDFPTPVIYILFLLGVVIGSLGVYSDRYGHKSFTNDPLGWRKAKKSYEFENSLDTASDKDNQP